jgi:ankyrin repeat protein
MSAPLTHAQNPRARPPPLFKLTSRCPEPAQKIASQAQKLSPVSRSTRWRHAKRWKTVLSIADVPGAMRELARGLDPNVPMSQGITPLMSCAISGDHQMLLTLGQNPFTPIDIEARPKLGLTAVGLATVSDHILCLNALIELGAQLDPQHTLALTPLMTAAKHGSTRCLSRLIDLGVDIDRRARDGSSALSLASSGGHLDCALLLLNASANPDTHTRQGHTPLMLACDKGAAPIARALLRFGAGLESRDSHGMSALMRSARAGKKTCAALLLQAGANPLVLDAEGMDAEKYASLTGHEDIRSHLALLRSALAEQAILLEHTMTLPLHPLSLALTPNPCRQNIALHPILRPIRL